LHIRYEGIVEDQHFCIDKLRHHPEDYAKWREGNSVEDLPTGPKQAQSTV
jgi:hypothetical protein